MPWFPRDKYLWDFWFARRQGALHVFYLQASRAACQYNPDRRHDLSSVGHAVLTPGGWREVGTALGPAQGEAWDNLSIWTGSVVWDAETETYYQFYTARRREDAPVWTPSEWQRKQQIGLAASRDLITWERTAESFSQPVIPNPGRMTGLDGVAWRDPYVVRGADGLWHAFVTARLNPCDRENGRFGADAGGVVAWLKSERLAEWDCYAARRLVTSDEFYQLEVPQVFWRSFAGGRRFYLLFCAQERDCSRERRARGRECATGTYYMFSELMPDDCADIPALEEPARLLAPGLYAGRLLDAETESQPLFFGFQWADERGRFAGGLSDPQPVRFEDDGAIVFC
jgi:beta-fructofuranosidase